ncbi:MAG: mqnB [Sphingobacteriaceae bacterium]|jgi:futalosine hydrolase|nr:mqnB [Sphingobacteriaceae bacterium]
MKILIVAATLPEIQPLLAELNLSQGENQHEKHQVSVLITGVGMVATAFALGKQLATAQYDFALNLGIAGSFDRSLMLGDVVNVTKDHFVELGAEDGDEFISIDELGFGSQATHPTPHSQATPHLTTLKQVRSITVNKVHGNPSSIATTAKLKHPQTESMEGAAFFYACNQVGMPCAQVRAISNYVERRNRDSWNIGLAVKNLNIFAEEFIVALLSP